MKEIFEVSNQANTINEIVKETIAKQMAIKENFIAHYLYETGAKIQDTVLKEKRSADGLTYTFWCEPLPKQDLTKEEELKKLNRVSDLAKSIVEAQSEMDHLLNELRKKDDAPL